MGNLTYHLSYFLQVAVLSVFWVFGLKRRRYFVLRLLGCIAVFVGIIVLITYIQTFLPPSWIVFSLPYLMIMALFGVVFWLCFDIPVDRVLLILLLPTTAQLCASSFQSLISFSWHARFYVIDTISTAIMCVVSFLLSRLFKDVYFYDPVICKVALISSYCIVLCLFVLNAFTRDIEDTMARYLIVGGYRFLMSVFVYFLVFSLLVLSRVRYDKSITEVILKKEEQQHALTRELTELINVKYHDIKHMENSGAAREFLEQDKKSMDLYELLVDCGNDALNTILTEKSAVCKNKDVDLTLLVDGAALGFMEACDIYVLFGNALDNAIECVSTLDKSERFVKLQVKSVQGMVSIVCENTCHNKLKFDNGLPRSTKNDDRYHGFGTKSIAKVCKKYGAEFRISCKDEMFVLEILMPKAD